MPGLTLGWEYLTGCCVATHPANRERAEWPPHPGRVFMALAAAWFETGEDPAQGEALRWLETLGDPEMTVPPKEAVGYRTVPTVFVPVNDSAGPSTAQLQSAPITRSKQPRTFPTVWVGDAPCFLKWPTASDDAVQKHRAALDRLCGEVTRIGHSSSLVRMWVADDVSTESKTETWVPDDHLGDVQARRVSQGTLDLLDRQFNRRGRETADRLAAEIEELAARKKTIRGKGATEQKAAIDQQMAARKEQLQAVDARDPIRPKLGLWSGYRRCKEEDTSLAVRTDFDSDVLILKQERGPRLPLASTLLATQALRGAILTHCDGNIPDWVCGHKGNGEPLRNGNQQLALVPLPFAGYDHADGHLLGLAIVFPRSISREERGRALGGLLVDSDGTPKEVELKLGRVGVVWLKKREWEERSATLQPEVWTRHPKGARTWASVTPVVLDRYPKCDPAKEYHAWRDEVTGIILTACGRLGLPGDLEVEIEFGTTSWHRGCPRAFVKRRPLRGQPEAKQQTAALGDGFPAYPNKGNGVRLQFHVWLRFSQKVVGPVLLGAGRFLGYGLFKPLPEGTSDE